MVLDCFLASRSQCTEGIGIFGERCLLQQRRLEWKFSGYTTRIPFNSLSRKLKYPRHSQGRGKLHQIHSDQHVFLPQLFDNRYPTQATLHQTISPVLVLGYSEWAPCIAVLVSVDEVSHDEVCDMVDFGPWGCLGSTLTSFRIFSLIWKHLT